MRNIFKQIISKLRSPKPETCVITRHCPICGKSHSKVFNKMMFTNGMRMVTDGATVSEAFSSLSHHEHNFIEDGICSRCFSLL